MNYIELEAENQKLRQILNDALTDKKGVWVGDSPWTERAEAVLKPPQSAQTLFMGQRWSGEKCGTCHHSSVFHPRGTICTVANCECGTFVASGKPV